MPSSNFAQAIQAGLGFRDQRAAQQRQRELDEQFQLLASSDNPALDQNLKSLAAKDPRRVQAIMEASRAPDVFRLNNMLNNAKEIEYMAVTGREGDIVPFLQQNIQEITSRGGDPMHSIGALQAYQQGGMDGLRREIQAFKSVFDPDFKDAQTRGSAKPADIKAFEDLLQKAGLSAEDSQRAARIKLGLDPRATGSADITIAEKGLAKEVADVKAEIKQAEKFAEMTGSARAKAIDSGFERIGKINSNISNIDRAIQLLDEGAETGAVEKFFPSVKGATIELNNLRNKLGLDIVGATTFGALSKGELDLALETALPTGLQEKELRDYLFRKKSAQEKLRGYLESQIEFLDQGGTKAGFLRMQKRQEAAPAERDEASILSEYGL